MHVQTTREWQQYITFHVRTVHTRVQVILAVVYTNETHDFQRSADKKCRVYMLVNLNSLLYIYITNYTRTTIRQQADGT